MTAAQTMQCTSTINCGILLIFKAKILLVAGGLPDFFHQMISTTFHPNIIFLNTTSFREALDGRIGEPCKILQLPW